MVFGPGEGSKELRDEGRKRGNVLIKVWKCDRNLVNNNLKKKDNLVK